MLRLWVLATSLVVAQCFLQPTHSCGDSQSRLHLRGSCKYALHLLDSMVPDVDSAIDEHNRRNFQEVLQHPETANARKAVQDCFSCVLAGGINCDKKPRDTGDQSLHRVARDWHGTQTGLSQNCLDHVAAQRRVKQGTPLFKETDLHVHDSLSLMEAPVVALNPVPELSKPRMLLDVPTDVVPTTSDPTMAVDVNDATLNNQAVGAVYDSATSTSSIHTAAAVESTRREMSEPVRDTFICAQIDNTFTGELVCPEGQRITSIEFASYGTPSDQEYKLDANLTDTQYLTKRQGVRIFKGEKCFNIDYASRSDCNAYDSRELVGRICHGTTRCTLSAIGDKRRLMAFQPLVCDLKLKLYVKARCGKAQVTNALGQSTLAAKELSMMGVDVDDVHRSVELDFSNPDHADFVPATLPVVSLAEIENGARPIVRAPIDPPPEFYNAFALKGEGRVCYKCAFTGVTDEDGMVYYWRPCDEDPQLTFVNLSPISANDVVATWNGDSNTYQDLKDGSFLKPDAIPTGLVTDYSVDQTSKTPVVNAPDFLYHVVSGSSSGKFANVHYIQRFQTTNGMPPNSNGQIAINGITYNKCNSAQARDNIAAEVPISATYVFYKERGGAAAPAPPGVPAWGVLLIVCGALLVITLVILGVMGKLPNLKSHRQADPDEEHLEETLADDEEAGEQELEEKL